MRVDKYSKELGRAESKNAAECSADVPAGLRSDLSEAAAVGNGNVLHTDSERYHLSNTVPSTLHPDIKVGCLLYTSPSPRDRTRSRMPSSA